MKKVNTVLGYDLYIGNSLNDVVYNAVPEGSKTPEGGYLDIDYIAKVKNINPLAWSLNNLKLIEGKEKYTDRYRYVNELIGNVNE